MCPLGVGELLNEDARAALIAALADRLQYGECQNVDRGIEGVRRVFLGVGQECCVGVDRTAWPMEHGFCAGSIHRHVGLLSENALALSPRGNEALPAGKTNLANFK